MTIGLVYLAAMLLGAIAGSFLNVVIYRGPTIWGLVGEDRRARGSLLAPRSRCPACKRQIKSWRLAPIVSFALQKGRCVSCGARIPIRYPLVEIGGAAVAAIALITAGPGATAIALALFGWTLIALAAIDWETGFLPDALTLPLILAGLGANFFNIFAPFNDALIGALAGYLSFRLVGFVFLRLRGVEGLGQGDAKLAAAIGAWGGWLAIPPAVFIAALVTLFAVLIGALAGKNFSRDTPVPGLVFISAPISVL